MNVPIPPTDLSQLFPWLKAAETLLALFLLVLRIPQLAAAADWVKATVGVFGGALIAFGAVYAQSHLTAEQLASVEPYYEAFVGVLTVVLGYFGAQAILVKPIKAWWAYRQTLWAENIEAKRAQLKAFAQIPGRVQAGLNG